MKRSEARFGLTDDEWDTTVVELREVIVKAAREGRMTSYGEIANNVTVIELKPYSTLMNYFLGEIFEQEHLAGRPLLTSIVTHKYGDKEPGEGFYEMARKLGYQFTDPLEFCATKVQEVLNYYGPPRRRQARLVSQFRIVTISFGCEPTRVCSGAQPFGANADAVSHLSWVDRNRGRPATSTRKRASPMA
jgi:hypothetical protein